MDTPQTNPWRQTMFNALKTFLAKISTPACGCGPACRCGSDCRCKPGQRCSEGCACAN
jgi:hypothetical protein